MATQTVTVKVSNKFGSADAQTGFVIEEGPSDQEPVIQSIRIEPASAPPGTTRTITVLASGSEPLTYTCTVGGTPATPTNLPNVFTYTDLPPK